MSGCTGGDELPLDLVPTTRGAVAGRVSVRLELAAGRYRRDGQEVTAGQMARALDLAVSWAVLAAEHRVTLADLAAAPVDLATIALAAVVAHDDRTAEKAAS